MENQTTPFPRNLKRLRENAGMTQDELGVKVGCTGQSIYKYENSVSFPSAQRLQDIADALDVELEMLFYKKVPYATPKCGEVRFENRIKELRKQNGITVKALSDVLGISQSMLTNYENGNTMPRDFKIWTLLAQQFDVSVGYLMGIADVKNKAEAIDRAKITVFFMRYLDGVSSFFCDDNGYLAEVYIPLLARELIDSGVFKTMDEIRDAALKEHSVILTARMLERDKNNV